ncbi:MAG: hypothetical protein Crog4KO_10930 [Crocinitomicaceae bacterium]
MEIFLEFLKYGAIGIAMVLVVLSYRLLSKEQDKEHVREPMLKSIKSYIILALVLAAFFGVTEIVSLMIVPKQNKGVLKEKIEGIYERNISDQNDKTINAKLKTIENFVERGVQPIDSTEINSLIDEINKLENDLKYAVHIEKIHRLKEIVLSDPEKFTNLYHNSDKKTTIFSLLGDILVVHGKLDASNLKIGQKMKNKLIQKTWVEYKDFRTDISDTTKNNVRWMVGSDFDYLLKEAREKQKQVN